MGEAIKAFVMGAAGAFDLSGNIFRQNTRQLLKEAETRTAAMTALRKRIDAKSTRRLSAGDSIALDWKNIGSDMRKAISSETLSLK